MQNEKQNLAGVQEEDGLIRISGSIEGVIYSNEENGYAICDMGTDDGDEIITIVGTLPMIAEGDCVAVWGRWVHNPKYGDQFKVEQYERQFAADVNSIRRYLASGAVRGIGIKTADRIIAEFGEDTLDVLENHPEWLATIKGISAKRAEEIGEDFRAKAGIRNAMLFFREFFGVAMTVRIYKHFGSRAVEIAKQNPYRLCEEVDGIGFEKADAMAQKLGYAQDGQERLQSGIRYLLSYNAGQSGHVCLPYDKLVAGGAQMLGAPEELIRRAVDGLQAVGKCKSVLRGGVTYVYDRVAYEAERYISSKMKLLDRVCAATQTEDIESFILKEEAANGVQYAPGQRRAIADALLHGVFVLTGGPGTGKTTVVRALINIFESMDFSVALAAPTGRAAKRLSESTSREAKTIHRLLEMSRGEGEALTFMRDENNLLEEHIVIVDEASMIDSALMCALLKAVKPGAKLIIIGDADQLPSVGAGNVLRDIIDSGVFATVRLTEIFRQARESLIVTNAHAINDGTMPRLDCKDGNFFFLPRQSDHDIALTVADLYRNRLPRSYGADIVAGIQVITPSRKGEAGTEHLNLLLQQALNPKSRERREYLFRNTVFREGDRVMQIRNNYDLEWTRNTDGSTGTGIFNGDIGVIDRINPAENCMEIDFDDRHAVYDLKMLEELEHAYAITVHKSQGSEYPVVILPAFSAPQMLMTRNLLYTAVTRARRMVIVVGRAEMIGEMVRNNRQSMRYTGLAAALKE
ncbi:MAG: ATP-dependent RecD-like DNA helicase [Clostridia bacterium]|nr:ATP-dependent RecD-like DNA helicase [Clostridia bacterium]